MCCQSFQWRGQDRFNLPVKAFENVNFNAGYIYSNRRADLDDIYLANSGTMLSDPATSSSVLNGVISRGSSLTLMRAAIRIWEKPASIGRLLKNWIWFEWPLCLWRLWRNAGGAEWTISRRHVDATYSYTEIIAFLPIGAAEWAEEFTERRDSCSCGIYGANRHLDNNLEDNSNAVGLLTRMVLLMENWNHRWFSYSLDESTYSTQVPYDPACGSTTGASALTCGTLSPINNQLISLKLTGNYKVHKMEDFFGLHLPKLTAMTIFTTAHSLVTHQARYADRSSEQDYTVNVVALSYNYAFQ